MTATANAIFRQKTQREYTIIAFLLSVSLNFLTLYSSIGLMKVPEWTGPKDREIPLVDLPPDIVIPPPPAKIYNPIATPVEAAPEEDVPEEKTIGETIPQKGPDFDVSQEVDWSQPSFTPYDVKPKNISNQVFYPPFLEKAGIEGIVILWLLIDKEGRVLKVQINKSSGNAAFDDAAVRGYQNARFTPAFSRDIPVQVWTEFPVAFKLIN